jgi:tRNA A37 threonylcarbamoyladenosine dehydratase
VASSTVDVSGSLDADLERRFGSLRRLWGEAGYARVRAARVAVVGVGGVGSWAVEALARCGVAELVLIDFDQIAESNINRQVQALGSTVGAAKVAVLRDRIADIHPGCVVHAVEAFVEAPVAARLARDDRPALAAQAGNWPDLLPVAVDLVIDACDQGAVKAHLAAWALADPRRRRLVIAGAAGGKTRPQAIEVDDLAVASHDPLLATLRQRVRKLLREAAPAGDREPARKSDAAATLGLRCVFSREPMAQPLDAACAPAEGGGAGLNCAGYGSSVMVTAAMGLAAAEEGLRLIRTARG